MSKLHDLAVRRGYGLGWRVAGALPEPLVALMIAQVSARVLRHNGVHVRTLRSNLEYGHLGNLPPMTSSERRLVSYLRNLYEVLALPSWSPRRVVTTVTTEGELPFRAAVAATGPSSPCRTAEIGIWPAPGPASRACP